MSTLAAIIRPTMPPWTPKYSDEQRDAVVSAYLDRGITPARKVVDLAKRGELRHGDDVLDPFEIPVLYVTELARNEKRKRMGRAKSGLKDAEPRDAVEALRRRLVSAADNMLASIEKRQRAKRFDPKDPELLRQIARATREIAAIPGPNEPRPVPPGQKIPGADGETNGDRTKSGLAGAIIAAARPSSNGTIEDDPRQSATQHTDEEGEHEAQQAEAASEARTSTSTQAKNEGGDSAPGSWMREQVGR